MATLVERAEAGTLTLVWRTVQDDRVCDDCADRHNVGGLNLVQWEANGLPGSGHTRCGGNCRCLLLPDSLLGGDVAGHVDVDPIILRDLLDQFRQEHGGLTLDEQLRITANALLLDQVRVGTLVVYRGAFAQFRGEYARVESVNARDGAVIRFEVPLSPLPEFQALQVFELADLVVVE